MPREQDVEEMEADSSAASAQDETAKADPVKAAADSSPATDETEESALSVVRNVVDETRKTEAKAAPSAEGEKAGEDAGDQATKKAPDDENYSDVPFNKHPRFQKLLRERNDFKTDAGRYRNIEGFLSTNGLAADEAADALTLFALAKVDPAKAWEQAKPWVQGLLQRAGEVLPDDLRQRVQAGELSREAAQEVSRLRATAQSAESRRTFEQEQAQRRQAADAESAMVNAATSWEADRRARDPNFDAKLTPLAKEVAYLQATEGKPKDADGVRDMLKRAYKAVNDQIASVTPINTVPKRREIRPVVGGQVAGNARAEGGSTLDIIRANRRAS